MIKLSGQQQAAVNHTGSPVLVAAGAGSGKTRTLIAKFAQLVQSGLEPTRILAITFTNKAANEMKARLVANTNIRGTQLPWVKTYHSACLSILKENHDLVGFRKSIQIYTTYYQEKLIKELLIKLNFDKKHTNLVLNHISNAKNSGSPDVYFNSRCKFSSIPFAEIYKMYEQELFSRNAVDFDNILLLSRNLLRDNKQIRENYKSFFQYVLCDEYQDTNNLNEEITDLLISKDNFFAVGDDWQSIYSFRMSNVDHFLSFLNKHPNGKIFKLEENYRSTNEIVQMGNHLISFNTKRMRKLCFSKREGGIVKIREFYNDYEEADWVSKKVRIMHARGIPYKKMAILYRTKFCSLPFEWSLHKNNIPYQIISGRGFFERMEILDLSCYMASAIFEKDDVSLERIINRPKRGIGQGTLKKLYNMRSSTMSLKQTVKKAVSERILPSKLYNSLKKLLDLLEQIKYMKPEQALRKVISATNYISYIENYVRSNSMELTSRIENIEQLIYSASEKNSIMEFLEKSAVIREDEDQKNDKNNGINLSTIHKVKGLEFEIVFVVGCEEHLFPHWKSMGSKKEIEEERRLMYVAITRAEQCLFITSSYFRKGQHNARSRFLDELEKQPPAFEKELRI